jgi:putative glutamine amidotransferase
MQPVIGITPEAITLRSRADGRGAFGGVSYSRAVELGGGIPLIVPLTQDRRVWRHYLAHCDGWLFSGGGDVAHTAYAPGMPAAQRAQLTGVDADRDALELFLIRGALRRGRPVLAICRGIQVLNVALGGTLVPDLAGHRHPQPDALCHALRWERDSRIGRLLGAAGRRTNSSHHQALDEVAAPLRVTARAPDGVVEAVEHRSATFCWGVQFHPERLVEVAPAYRRLFRALVRAARQT